MTLAEWFLLVPTMCYLASSGVYLANSQPGFALTYFAYSLANVGLMMASISGGSDGH